MELFLNDKPLASLISDKGFNQYQRGLRSRFRAYGLIYELTYCEVSDDSAMRLDFESLFHIGRVTVWESGKCDLEILKVPGGSTVFSEHHRLQSENEFHQIYPRLTEYMRDALGWP